MGGTESGARGEKNKPPVEERRSREDISGMSCLAKPPSFPLLVVSLYPRLAPFPPTEEHCHCGSGAKGKSVSLNVLLSPFCLSPLFLYFSISLQFFSSAASSKCLQITQLWNSTLHLYLCLLGQYASCGLRFCSVADKKKFLISLIFLVVKTFHGSAGVKCTQQAGSVTLEIMSIQI